MSVETDQAQSLSTSLDLVVVDDDSLTLEIVSRICQRANTRFRLYSDSEAAMEQLSHSLPDTLIVDFFMPEQNGLEFLVKLNERFELGTCAVYLCSSVTPAQPLVDQINAQGARILDKSVIYDRRALLALLDHKA